MKNADFYALLSDPAFLKKTDKAIFEQLIRSYPYFPTAYLLAAKKSHLDKESSFGSKLDTAAAYAIDRVKLFQLINEPATIPALSKAVESAVASTIAPESGDQTLDELLQSIHDRKQSILSREEEPQISELHMEEDLEEMAMDELRSAGSEYRPQMEEIPDHDESEEVDIISLELEMMKKLDQHLAEQEGYESTEELIVMNELGGGGSEYVPLEEPLDEETEEFIIDELDPEVASISVLEEEFALHDLDIDIKENEILRLSEQEASLQIDYENRETMEVTADPELQAVKELEMEWEAEDEYNKHEELLTVNEFAGGGSEFIMIEINEEEKSEDPIMFLSESDSLMMLEEKSEVSQQKREEVPVEATSSLRFSEHVASPGAFLPEKSYTFREWLQFFKAEPTNEQKVVAREEADVKPAEKKSSDLTGELKEGTLRTGFRDELEVIDKIVSALKPASPVRHQQLISPSDLARKSLESDEDLVSETLAKIYEEQGLIDKAIRQYARLSLKFPEKSLSFAARITALKSKK